MQAASEPARSTSSDAALLEFLRVEGTAGIGDLATALGVTATAVRQRLERLRKSGLVERLGGDMPLDLEAARKAMADRLAGPTGLSIERVASGIFEIVNETTGQRGIVGVFSAIVAAP